MKKAGQFLRFHATFWGLVSSAGLVAGLATGAGFFASFFWFFDLFAHFRVQYFLGLSVIAMLLLIPRQRKAAACFGLLALVNLGTIIPMYFGRLTDSVPSGRIIRVMLMNVNTRGGKPEQVLKALRQYDPDVVVLEEVDDRWTVALKSAWYEFVASKVVTREDNFGIAVFSKLPFSRAEVVYIGEEDIPSIIVECEVGESRFTVLATHPVPPAGGVYSRWRNTQLAELPKHVKEATSPVLLIGDLNVSPWSPYFTRLVRDSGLKDSARGRGVQPTWPSFSPVMLIPLDHCLYSPQIGIVDRQVGPNIGSDHYPLIVDVRVPPGE